MFIVSARVDADMQISFQTNNYRHAQKNASKPFPGFFPYKHCSAQPQQQKVVTLQSLKAWGRRLQFTHFFPTCAGSRQKATGEGDAKERETGIGDANKRVGDTKEWETDK